MEEWTLRKRTLGGGLGYSYAVDLPNGATIITSSDDDNAEKHMRLVATIPNLLKGLKDTLARFVSSVGENSDFEDDRQFIKSMRDLIAQAEGRRP